MDMDHPLNDKLIALRRMLHQYPEASHEEVETAARVKEWLQSTNPDEIITGLGGHGLAAVYKSSKEGPTLLFRCELDALPVAEISDVPYHSVHSNRGHLCGHDGHMVIMAGVSEYAGINTPLRGRLVLLFQPAEETGEGAALVLDDPKFKAIEPDYAFAIHNLPGFDANSIIISNGIFSAASAGIEIKLTGKTSHAAEPERGINPAKAVARIILALEKLITMRERFKSFVLVTVIQIQLGEKAFGTSPGHAIVRATLRSYLEEDMHQLKMLIEEAVNEIGRKEKLQTSTHYMEEFPSTTNDIECVQLVENIIETRGWDKVYLKDPFKWSEDFGHFTGRYKGALLGLGSGTECPSLHNPDYDFPDEIIRQGVGLFAAIYDKILR